MTNTTYLAGVADDAEVPMVILVDGDDHKILLEDINFSGPSFDSIVPGIQNKFRFQIETSNTYLLTTGSFRASMGLGLDVNRENQKVVNMCTL